MKINWFSNAPWAATGYGNQTGLFVPRLKALGHDLSVTAFYGLEGGILNWNGIPVYPRGRMPYGQDIWAANAHHVGADVAISLIDAWVCAPEMNPHGIPWVPWYPVDSDRLAPAIVSKIRQAHKRIVFSKHAVKQTNDAGLDCYYVPHGVDTKLYRPLDMADARQKCGFPKDAFIVGMVAANKGQPPRKAFQPQLEAFAEFKKRHADAILYVHTCRAEHGEDGGLNLPNLVKYLGLVENKDVFFADPYMYFIGFPPEVMVNLYNSFDVHMLVSMGEGFGIPIVEAQACGCPVIVGDWTSMGELCFSGWKVDKKDADPFWTPLECYQYQPRRGAILDALEAAYTMRGNQDYRSRARDGALQYDADKVTEKYWKPVLEKIDENIHNDGGKMKLVKF